jgi:hypothetical protein
VPDLWAGGGRTSSIGHLSSQRRPDEDEERGVTVGEVEMAEANEVNDVERLHVADGSDDGATLDELLCVATSAPLTVARSAT